MINHITFQGYLHAPPELRETDAGQPVCNATLINIVRWKNDEGEQKEKTTWATIALFGHGAITFAEHHEKGDLCLVEGRVANDNWVSKATGTTHEKMKIIVEAWHFSATKRDKMEAA